MPPVAVGREARLPLLRGLLCRISSKPWTLETFMPESTGDATLDLGSFSSLSSLIKSMTSEKAGAMKVSTGGLACLTSSQLTLTGGRMVGISALSLVAT